MQYTRLGDTGLVVSRLAFGAMTFGTWTGPFAAISKVNQSLADELVAKALDRGVNHFNTANVYTGGQSEEMLGRALGKKRKDVVISTKVGFRSGESLLDQGLSRHHILTSVEGSLRRLGTDYIDVYLAHRVDRFTPMEETLEALDTVVRQGKTRYIGFSNWPAWMASKAVGLQRQNGWARFRAAEMYYSMVGRDLEHEIVPFVRDAGIGVLVWSPLAGGFLSGKYSRENPQGDGGRLASLDFIPFDRDKGYTLLDRLREIGEPLKASVAQVALAWLLTRPAVASVLIGANRLAQLEDNLGAAAVELPAEAIAELDKMTAPVSVYPGWFLNRAVDLPVQEALEGKKS